MTTSELTNAATDRPTVDLFTPFKLGSLELPNRIVMAPMTRAFAPGGVPSKEVAAYYRRRAEGGVGLIITEGTWIPEPHASNDPNVPRFFGDDALAGWKAVLDAVKSAGGHIIPQLWHVGTAPKPDVSELYGEKSDGRPEIGPSGLLSVGQQVGEPMSLKQIEDTAQAYVDAAVTAWRMGFDGVELHGAHGYLIDQFFWQVTNRRTDAYGGDLSQRTRFAADIVRAIRRATSPDFPILLRFSQWKIIDYKASLATSPAELSMFLSPLVDAGVDIFHASQRRFWEPEFRGSDRNLAGWTKHLTGKPVITVGSVSLDTDTLESMVDGGAGAGATSLGDLPDRLAREEFDLVAVGRALIANPEWPHLVRKGDFAGLRRFEPDLLTSLD